MNGALPIEIWQKIMGFCDDESLRTIDKHLPHLIDSKHPSWRSECRRLRKLYAIPEYIFNKEIAKNVDFVKILLHQPFSRNLILSAKMFTENIIASFNSSYLVPYQSHDESRDGIITYRFLLEKLGLSSELLDGSFRLSFNYYISSRLDRFVRLEMKTIVKSIDDGYFYGDEREDDCDSKSSFYRLKPSCYSRTFSVDYTSAEFVKNPVEDQELSIRLQIPHGLSISNIRLNWIPILENNVGTHCDSL